MLKKFQARKDEGFTLIELLIVIIVLGILVAIVLFGLGTFKSDSQSAACKADMKQLRTAATAYIAGHPGKSTDTQGLVDAGYLQSLPDPNADKVTLTATVNNDGTYSIGGGPCP